MRKVNKILWIYITSASIATLILVYIWNTNPSEGSIEFEVSKLLMQFILIFLIGGLISYQVQDYSRQKEHRTLMDEYRKEVHNRLVQAYSDAKKVRRIMIAQCLKSNKIFYNMYDEHIRTLIDVQLSLEIIGRDVEVSVTQFKKGEKLFKKIKAMDEYLKIIIDEYKLYLKDHENIPELIKLNDTSELKDAFLFRGKDNRFFTGFVVPYRGAIELIRSEILTED